MSNSIKTSPRLVVGIAASAGGQAAVQAMFSTMPPHSGLAFVVLPCLNPGEHSRLLDQLAAQTGMTVAAADDDRLVEADHIYVLPPAGSLAIRAGRLQLSADVNPQQSRGAIDDFLCSLATDQAQCAVAVVLSGSGSHGTLGLSEVKLAGGIVMAQDPTTAGCSQMPDSAIATGLVDLVLAPAKMPAALIDWASRPYRGVIQHLDSGLDTSHRAPGGAFASDAAFSGCVGPVGEAPPGSGATDPERGSTGNDANHDPLQALLTCSNIGVLWIDREMRIRLYTPLAARLLDLHPGALGRPISELSTPQANDNLVQQAKQVLDSLVAIDKDVWSGGNVQDRLCYLRRIAPYRSTGTEVDGAIVTFADITERRHMEERLEANVTERTRELSAREIRLQAVMNSVVDAIIIIGTDGLIQSANPVTERIFGYGADELIGHNVSILMPSPYREEHDRYLGRYLETGKTNIIGRRRELTGCRKDGSVFPLELTVSEIDHLGLFTGVVRDLSEKRALEREVANTSTLEQERIGREIHDGIGQQLTGLNILAVSLKNDLAAAGCETNRKLDDMIQQLTALIGDSRTLARGLAPVAIGPRGLLDALARFADQVNDTTDVACSFRHNLNNGDLWDGAAATQMYRIAQEAANNALKYANAGRIDIELRVTGGNTELTVSDDGRGFDLEAVQQSDGFGLRIMQYRAGILGGQLSIDTAPDNGTQVRFRIPYQAPQE